MTKKVIAAATLALLFAAPFIASAQTMSRGNAYAGKFSPSITSYFQSYQTYPIRAAGGISYGTMIPGTPPAPCNSSNGMVGGCSGVQTHYTEVPTAQISYPYPSYQLIPPTPCNSPDGVVGGCL